MPPSHSGWVREMYAWDVAIAKHPEIKVRTEKPPQSTLMVQPPFDEGMFNASFCHYTVGAGCCACGAVVL